MSHIFMKLSHIFAKSLLTAAEMSAISRGILNRMLKILKMRKRMVGFFSISSG